MISVLGVYRPKKETERLKNVLSVCKIAIVVKLTLSGTKRHYDWDLTKGKGRLSAGNYTGMIRRS